MVALERPVSVAVFWLAATVLVIVFLPFAVAVIVYDLIGSFPSNTGLDQVTFTCPLVGDLAVTDETGIGAEFFT